MGEEVGITVNGGEQVIPAKTTVVGLLEILGVVAERIAVEVNHEIVTRRRHATHVLSDGDRVEIVTMVGGG